MRGDFSYVKNHLVLTDHSEYNKRIKRKSISIESIINAIVYARFIDFAGNKRYKVTYEGITVVYKMDYSDPENPLYVVITYYGKANKREMQNAEKVLTY